VTDTPNAVGRALGLLGDEWNLLIVREAQRGPCRYSQLQSELGIGPSVLSARLSALTSGGVLTKSITGYRLTASGKDLWALLLSIWAWEQRWVQGAALPTMRHEECGQVFTPVLSCSGCGRPCSTGDVEVHPGPSGSMERSVPAGTNRRRTGGVRPDAAGLFPETMALLGSRWSAGLLGCAFLGAQRFSEFGAMLGAPANVLAERLRSFVALDVLDEQYRLTEKGRDFFPTVALLVAWGETWQRTPDGPALVARHRSCEGALFPRLQCSCCTGVLNRSAVLIEGHPEHVTQPLLQRTS
jgi:DNA-binding HxlR family transcriptional regulator